MDVCLTIMYVVCSLNYGSIIFYSTKLCLYLISLFYTIECIQNRLYLKSVPSAVLFFFHVKLPLLCV